MTTTLDTPADLTSKIGQHLGISSWRRVTRHDVDTFAAITGDDQWIHTDVGRASEGPFGTTIVHAYLTLSMAPAILAEVVRIREAAAARPLGLQDVRFPAPLPVGARVRAAVVVKRAEQKLVGFEAVFSLSYEIEGGDQSACLAEVIVVYP
ncbi:MAG: MaoC family dehydratase [Mycobacterium sp.]